MSEKTGPDYSATLYLPKTDFPMRAGLPKKEPELLAHWESIGLTEKMRQENAGKPKFVLHDGPPYANGNIHIGHALNKILKDLVTRSQRMLGKDANYVPGWDCHGLPIEWKIEEQYRAKGRNKDEVPVVEFRRECRAFARTLARNPARGVQAPRRRRRLGRPLRHHGLFRRKRHCRGNHEIRRQRPALSRLQAGDVVGGGKDGARRGGSGI